MSKCAIFNDLTLPLIGAPMFLVSNPALVIAQCRAGIVGTFPALNARPSAQLGDWIAEIEGAIAGAPYGINLIVHPTNTRLEEDLAICVAHKVPLIITSVGPPSRVVERIHSYGGIVLHDVINIRHAKKAIASGVDGLILVCAGAGGHGGLLNPFAFVAEMREFYDGPLILSGAIGNGRQIRAAEIMGADYAYMGTRFIAVKEAAAPDAYKQMILESNAADLVYTKAFTGVAGNYLRASIERAGLDPDNIVGGKDRPDLNLEKRVETAKAWKDIWGAGQGVGTIHDLPSVAELVARLKAEYESVL